MSVLALVATVMTARQLDIDDAHSIATDFMKSQSAIFLNSHQITWQLAHSEPSAVKATAADYYIFNASDGSSFIIIAGDDRAHEVLAYGNGNINDMSQLPNNVRWMLEQYAEQIEYLHGHPEIKPIQSSVAADTVPQLLTTSWGQGTPYRNLCPTVNGSPCVTGCTATSMAQVMNYWNYPEALPTLPAYTTSTLNINVSALPIASIEWELMLDSYREGNYNAEQGNAVATLMRYCGQSCKMDYTIADSGAWPWNQLEGLKKFGYNQDATFLERANYSDNAWNGLIIEDLTAHRPVIYSGKSNTTVHSFVIDGYDGSKYHINWGWDGALNGYFELDAMNAGGFNPSSDQQMLHGVHPGNGVPQPTDGFDFAKDGFCFLKLGEDSVAIGRSLDLNYSGGISIPDHVSFNGKVYTVTAIAEGAFARINNLTDVILPNTITRIGRNAFYNSGLNQIELPNSVTVIEYGAFNTCAHLNHVVLSENLMSIGEAAFASCTSLNNILIPNAVKSIQAGAFKNCTALSDVTIGTNVTTIGSRAFENCSSLSSIELPNSIVTLDSLAFHCTALGEITIPESVTTIGPSAFKDCSSLTTVYLPDSLNEIDDFVFYGTRVDGISIPDGVTRIGKSAFAHDNRLTEISIPASVLKIDDSAFASCSNLTSINVSEGLKQIGNQAFSSCSRLQSFSIPVTVGNIGNGAFESCTSLTEMVIPDEVTSIGNGLFSHCTGLNSAIIGNGTNTIPDNTFNGCTSLTQVIMPSTITRIGKYAFNSTESLVEIAMPSALTILDDYAFQYSGIKKLDLGDTVESLGNYACLGCQGLSEVTIGKGLKTIGSMAFWVCNISTITIKAKIPPAPVSWVVCFSNQTYSTATLFVPLTTLNAYQQADEWKKFRHIVEICMSNTLGDLNCDEEVNIADVNVLIDAILSGDNDLSCDLDGDNEIGIADLNTLIEIIIQGH